MRAAGGFDAVAEEEVEAERSSIGNCTELTLSPYTRAGSASAFRRSIVATQDCNKGLHKAWLLWWRGNSPTTMM